MDAPGTQPTLSLLESLPLHLLQHICTFIPSSSVPYFSLASRICCAAANPRRFSRIRLTIRTKQKLQDDIQRCVAILGRDPHDTRFRHVRRVVVVGSMFDDGQSEQHFNDGMKLSARLHANDGGVGSDSESGSDAEIPMFREDMSPLERRHRRAQEASWMALAQFLARVPGLTDLVYACEEQVPACLLTALDHHCPRSRLRVRTFSLPCLYRELDDNTVDPGQHALITSPRLYSVHIRGAAFTQSGRFNLNLEAMDQMVLGQAPALKRVYFHHRLRSYGPGDRSISMPDGIRAPTASWRGLARLETLALNDRDRPSHMLESWSNLTDFSYLRRFNICPIVSLEPLRILTSMAAANKFLSLQDLYLSIDHERTEAPTAVDEQASLFFQSIPPLQKLRIYGFGPLTLNTILHCHGPTLRRLNLLTPESTCPGLAHRLSGHLPRVETLCLRVQRYQGGPEEVAAYRALGRALPRLARLTLLLDCGLVQPIEDLTARARATLVNCAVDAALARAIFDELVAAGARRLEWLRVNPDSLAASEAVASPRGDLDELASWVAKSWVCRREPGEWRRVVLEEPVDGWERVYGERKYFRAEYVEAEGEECPALWEELWPRRGGDWMEEWSGFPLSAGHGPELEG